MKKLSWCIAAFLVVVSLGAPCVPRTFAAETSVSVPSSLITSLIAAIEGLKSQIALLSEKVVTTTADAVFDAVWKKTFHWITFFESIDGYAKDGATLDGHQVILSTKAVAGSESYLQKSVAWQGLATFGERSYFRTSFTIPKETIKGGQYTGYIAVGNAMGAGATQYYGFKFENGSLYGVSSNGGQSLESKTLLMSSITDAVYNVEARYSPGKDIQFFVNPSITDQSPKATLSVGTLATGVNGTLFTASIKTLNAAQKALQFSYFEYFQKRSVLK